MTRFESVTGESLRLCAPVAGRPIHQQDKTGNDGMNTKTAKQPVKRFYMLAAILMVVGIAKFPFGGGASLDPNALAVSVALIAISVACVIRGRRNKRDAA